MGAVYAAFDERLEREVALKVLLEDDGAAQKRRFLREARLAAQVTHPNIATVYEVDEIDGRITIVMELLEGMSLRKLLADRKLEPDEALHFARDIARALARAHKSGIVHRDIKPENVFITEPAPGAFLAKVLDFGLARQDKKDPAAIAGVTPLVAENTSTTTTAHIWGTPSYMSPEQAEGMEVDARSDVFSFGSVLYEMLAGIRPFRAENTVALLIAIARKEPRSIRDIVPTLSPELEEILLRCLKKSRDERYADGAALSAAIEALSRGTPLSTRDSMRGSAPSVPILPPVGPAPEPSANEQPSQSSQATPFSTTRDPRPTTARLLDRVKRTTKRERVGAIGAASALVLLLGIVAFASSSKTTTSADAAAAAVLGSEPPPPPTTIIAPPPPSQTAALELEPEPTATAAAATATTTVRKIAPRSSAPKGKPADCAQPFIIDSKGVKIPKMHCL